MLDAVPSSLQPKVKAALHNIMNAEDKEAAELAIDQLQETYGAKYPKAVDKVLKDREVLLTHFDFPELCRYRHKIGYAARRIMPSVSMPATAGEFGCDEFALPQSA